MCVISNNRLAEWQEQVCSPVFWTCVGWTLLLISTHLQQQCNGFWKIISMFLFLWCPQYKKIQKLNLLAGWRSMCCQACLVLQAYLLQTAVVHCVKKHYWETGNFFLMDAYSLNLWNNSLEKESRATSISVKESWAKGKKNNCKLFR